MYTHDDVGRRRTEGSARLVHFWKETGTTGSRRARRFWLPFTGASTRTNVELRSHEYFRRVTTFTVESSDFFISSCRKYRWLVWFKVHVLGAGRRWRAVSIQGIAGGLSTCHFSSGQAAQGLSLCDCLCNVTLISASESATVVIEPSRSEYHRVDGD